MVRSKKLSHEDRILWGKVARSIRPMPGKLDEIILFEEAEEALQAQNLPAPALSSLKQTNGKSLAGVKPVGQHQPLERPVKRKIARGRLALEARIDLHDMFQSEAHAMLHDFLVRAHQRGLRHVLVITGKGSSIGSEGALKRAVPMWFSKPEFGSLISSFETAAPQHGGEGAIYVRLSRKPGDNT